MIYVFREVVRNPFEPRPVWVRGMPTYLFIGGVQGVACLEINAREKKVKQLLREYNRKQAKHGVMRTWRTWIRFLKSKGLKVRKHKFIEIYF